MNVRHFAILALAAAGCGKAAPTSATAPQSAALQAEEPGLPVAASADGWTVTEDCTLGLDHSPYSRETQAGKFLFATSVTVTPTARKEAAVMIRTTDKSLKDSIANGFGGGTTQRPVLKLFAGAIPLPESMAMESGGRIIIAGGAEGRTLGGEVVSKLVKKGTRIMPAQNAEVVDEKGTVVLRVPQ